MKFRSAREVHDAYEELERLLALRQAPVVALELRRRFLAASIDAGDSVWMAYGLPAAAGLFASLRDSITAHHPPDLLRALQDVAQALRGRPIPDLPGAGRWSADLDCVLERLREPRAAGKETPDDAPRPAATEEGRCEIAIPVVAKLIDPRRTHPLYAGTMIGLLSRLEVRVDFASHPRAIEPLGIDGEVSMETRAAFAQSLVLLDRFRAWGAPAAHRCAFRARFFPPGTRVTGRSGSLGFLLAAATARASYSMGPSYRRIADGSAATGDLAGTRVLPVDPLTLPDKIRACQQGRVRHIILPEAQAEEANRILRSEPLPEDCPIVEVIPVADALSFWSGGAHTLLRRRRSIRATARIWSDRLTRSRARMGVLGATAVLLAALLIVWFTLRAAPPVSAEWEGNDLVLRNSHRLVTGRIDLPHAPDFAGDPQFPSMINRAVVDLDGDRRQDAVAIHGSRPLGRDLLTAVDGRGRTLWSRRSDRLVPPSVAQPGDMCWCMIALAQTGPQPVELLAVSRSHQGSLSILARLDPVSGGVRGVLMNHGHLDHAYPLVLPGIDNDLIAFSGTENRFGRAITAIIDPRGVTTASDSDPAPFPPGLVEAAALSNGAIGVWSFALDRYTAASRTSAEKVYRENDGRLRVEVLVIAGKSVGTIIYELDVADPTMPIVLGAYFVDGTKDLIRGLRGPIPDAEFTAEARRLAREVRTLTPDGWRPARLGPGFLPEETQPVSSSSAREGLR